MNITRQIPARDRLVLLSVELRTCVTSVMPLGCRRGVTLKREQQQIEQQTGVLPARHGQRLPRQSRPSNLPTLSTSSLDDAVQQPPGRSGRAAQVVVTPLLPRFCPHRTARMKMQRAARRQAHLAAAKAAKSGAKTFLEANTVRTGTAASYDQHSKSFWEWLQTSGPDQELDRDELDSRLMEYFEHLYFEGHTHSAGQKVLAALEYEDRRIKKGNIMDPVRARDALRGFRRLAPGLSRAPLPYVALCALIGAVIYLGFPLTALAWLVQFHCYLRPSELLALRGDSWVRPTLGSGVHHWALILHPQEGGNPSKTAEWDESLILDWPVFSRLTSILDRIRKRPADLAFGLKYVTYLDLFRRASEISGVVKLQAHPYAIRHGGASHDALEGRRSLAAVKARGRWRADSSVRRYEKHARVLRETERLDEATRRYGLRVSKHLAELLLGKVPPPKPPFTAGLPKKRKL